MVRDLSSAVACELSVSPIKEALQWVIFASLSPSIYSAPSVIPLTLEAMYRKGFYKKKFVFDTQSFVFLHFKD